MRVDSADAGVGKRQDTSTSLVLANGLDLLSLIATTNGELSLRDIGRLLHLSPTVTHRLVATLRHKNFLEKNPMTGKYVIGIESFRVGRSFTESMSTEAVAKPILQSAGQKYKVNCFLGVRKDTSIVYLYDFSAARRNSIRLAPGTEVPLVSTAMGLAILAGMDDAQLDQFKRSLVERKDAHPVSLQGLDDQVRLAREKGYAQIISELFPGVSAVGAAIRSPHSNLEVAISFGLPSKVGSYADIEVLGAEVLTTARTIEAELRRHHGLPHLT